MTEPTLPLDLNEPGIIGTRSIRALQLVRIGRHPSTAMLIPAQGLWVVSGRGPQIGSNGAGKTVLLGALSLLHGDAQWNDGNGTGPNAARLLFDYDRARVADATYSNASRGYIVGVFFPSTGAEDPVSVWMRIERHSAPYVQVRWEHGIRLITGDSESERAANADELWNSLRPNGTLTVTGYAAKLYGDAPRCIASIRARGSEENQDRGLLALGNRSFRPSDLASQVITLAGKQNALDTERALRQELDANQQALDRKKTAFEEQLRRENRELADIKRRKDARALCADAAFTWETYLTVLHLTVHHEARELDHAVGDLEDQIIQKNADIAAKQAELDGLPSRDELLRLREEARIKKDAAIKHKEDLADERGRRAQRKDDLERRISELRPQAEPALTLGTTIQAAETSLTAARDGFERADQDFRKAEREFSDADDFLRKIAAGAGGPAGPALEALQAAEINAVSILDLIALSEADRVTWEGRLSPYARTIVISRDDIEDIPDVLAAYPGTPVIACDGAVDDLGKTAPGEAGLLGEFLRCLGERMPETGPGWVEDPGLQLTIQGGYDPPLTDRQSAIGAATETVRRLGEQLTQQRNRRTLAEKAVTRAEALLAGARAAEEMTGKQADLDQLLSGASELAEKIATAKKEEDETRAAFDAAADKFANADQCRAAVEKELRALNRRPTAASPPGLLDLTESVADIREKRRKKQSTAESLRQVTGIDDPDGAEAKLADRGVPIGHESMADCFHNARRQLRVAIETILDMPVTADAIQGPRAEDGPARAGGDQPHHLQLDAALRDLHTWCDTPQSAESNARPFEAVERPLRSWLDWNGADDEDREADIRAGQARERAEIEAAEHETEESRKWLKGRQDIQVGIIDKMFQRTENTLRELLTSVGQDPVKLNPRHADVGDTSQPLRWEVFPQWQPPGRKPVDYSNPPNTAELIILHLLLATASLVASTAPRGRILVLDESGNNLDAPNLTRVSRALQQVSEKYGLTVVLACQDLYTDLVAEHSAGMIQLVRSSPQHALNAPPVIQGDDDPRIVEALRPYLDIDRPEASAT